MRTVSGGKWTVDGRWVVIGPMIQDGPEVIIFDPSNGDDWTDLQDCIKFVSEIA